MSPYTANRTSNIHTSMQLENLKLSDRGLYVEPVSYVTAPQMADLQSFDLYPGMSPEILLAREALPFEPIEGDSRYRGFVLRDENDVYSVAHLRFRHSADSQKTERILHEDERYFLAPFSDVYPSQNHEIEIGGAVVKPDYQGQGVGSLLMRALTNIALAEGAIITRTAKGRYNPDQMDKLRSIIQERGVVDEQEILDEGMKYLSRTRGASTASVRMAEEFDMNYGGISLNFGGPFFYMERKS